MPKMPGNAGTAKPNGFPSSRWLWVAFAVAAAFVLAVVLWPSKHRDYNGSASAGDFWRMTNYYGRGVLRVENRTAGGAPIDLPYVKNADDFFDVTGEHASDYPRFVEIPGLMLVLQTNRAGPQQNKHANVIGVKKETLKVTMADNPHLYYQFRKNGAGGEVGFVTFLKGSNASDDPDQAAPSPMQPLDPDGVMGRA